MNVARQPLDIERGFYGGQLQSVGADFAAGVKSERAIDSLPEQARGASVTNPTRDSGEEQFKTHRR
jgi:hypothetical protein